MNDRDYEPMVTPITEDEADLLLQRTERLGIWGPVLFYAIAGIGGLWGLSVILERLLR